MSFPSVPAELKIKRHMWIECFRGHDRNSVINQVWRMINHASVFNVINESRRVASADPKGRPDLSPMLHQFINATFFDSQFLAIRRLVDSYSLEGKRGVCSLIPLLNDMKCHVGLMTRHNIFVAEDLEYDYESIRQRELDYMLEQSKDGAHGGFLPGNLDSSSVLRRHEQIDVLAGVSGKERTPQDVVRGEVFDRLIGEIMIASDDIKTYTEKFIAHSASIESRSLENADEIRITLNHLKDAYKIICQTVSIVGSALLSCGSYALVTEPMGGLRLFEKPLVPSDALEKAQAEWNEFKSEADSWGLVDLKSFFNK